MHRYTVRPGYGSEELLIEFGSKASVEDLRNDIFAVLRSFGADFSRVMNMVNVDYFEFKSAHGSFVFEEDDWGLLWIFAARNQKVIPLLDAAFKLDRRFTRYEVDFADYKRPSD